ncbi:MAG: 3-oxoacyl-ACP reductase family protein [Nitrospirota bacterium]
MKNRTAIISGATRGIGRAIALELARMGVNISFNFFRSSAEALSLEKEVADLGVKAKAFQADIKDYNAVKSWVDESRELFGGLDIIINNAGVIRDKALALMLPEDWHDVINTNLIGTFNLSRAAVIGLIKQKSGIIINITSVSGMMGMPRQTNYSASKAGIIGFTKSLSREVAPYKIRVNAVAPGFIETDMVKGLNKEYMEQMIKQIPLNRLGRSEEVAKLVKFLVSDDADYITGQTFIIDGGLSTV